MSTAKSHSDHKKVIEILKQVKEESRKNDMLGAAILIAKLNSEFGFKPEKIETELKKVSCKISLPHVYNHIKLAAVPKQVKSQIKSGKIKATEVLGLMHKHQEPSELIKLVEKAIQQREKHFSEKQKRMAERKETEKSKTLIERISRAVQNVTGKKVDKNELDQLIQKLAV